MKYFIIAFFIIFLNSCKTDNTNQTIFFIKKNGEKPKIGNDVKFNYQVWYPLVDGGERFISGNQNTYETPKVLEHYFKGDFTDCITQMGVGDSALFYVSADSLYNIIRKEPLPTYMRKGDQLKFYVKLYEIVKPANGEIQIGIDPKTK